MAGGRKVGARYRQKSRPRCRKRGYDSSFGQIHFPGTESLLERPSFPGRPRLAYEATQAIVALVSSATDTLITPPFKTWARLGAPALAISFFPLAQSAAPTAWKESLSEHQNCLDHSRNHPAVPPRITAGTTVANTTTLSSEFQITIPKEVREAQNWKPGQEIAFIPKCGGLPSRSLSRNPIPTRHRQGRNHHQLPRSQGPRLIRVIDTSAWIGWLIGCPSQTPLPSTSQSGIPGWFRP